ncbi:MAG: UDP-glucose--hexose-1-phosphate uridylyltransferase [Candidatus Omnitrophota bacterium]|nr:UDP-glucose--hexose-1-phosphate uridylyltransferase [Candidatus Omnitrophota bacterium]
MAMKLSDSPHRRYNALTGEWVLISPYRAERPWLGERENPPREERSSYDEKCYLCPGNVRAKGQRNPDYESTYVFTNDYAALLPETDPFRDREDPLLVVERVNGTCRVICFSPRHDLTLAEMPPEDIRKVVDVWAEQVLDLGKTYRWVQIFENRGEIMGCSNQHPHCQVRAESVLPNEPSREDRRQSEYYEENRTVLLMDYLKIELELGKRIIIENEHWAVLVPFWAVWPFETFILPKRNVKSLPDLSGEERDALADILKKHLTRYDNLFNCPFPYTMGWHGAPADNGDHPYWQLHAHYYPPLLRSATVKKFMVGYEMLSEPQRDITAEQAAERLRRLPDEHYRVRKDQ